MIIAASGAIALVLCSSSSLGAVADAFDWPLKAPNNSFTLTEARYDGDGYYVYQDFQATTYWDGTPASPLGHLLNLVAVKKHDDFVR